MHLASAGSGSTKTRIYLVLPIFGTEGHLIRRMILMNFLLVCLFKLHPYKDNSFQVKGRVGPDCQSSI